MDKSRALTISESLADIAASFNRCVSINPNNLRDIEIFLTSCDRIAAALSAERMEEIEGREGK